MADARRTVGIAHEVIVQVSPVDVTLLIIVKAVGRVPPTATFMWQCDWPSLAGPCGTRQAVWEQGPCTHYWSVRTGMSKMDASRQSHPRNSYPPRDREGLYFHAHDKGEQFCL